MVTNLNFKSKLKQLQDDCEHIISTYIFDVNNYHTRNNLIGALSIILSVYKNSRFINNYKVICDYSNNTSNDIDYGDIVATIMIQIRSTLNYFEFNVVLSGKRKFYQLLGLLETESVKFKLRKIAIYD